MLGLLPLTPLRGRASTALGSPDNSPLPPLTKWMRHPAEQKSTPGVVLPTRYLRGASPEVASPAKPSANSPRDLLLSLTLLQSNTQLIRRSGVPAYSGIATTPPALQSAGGFD